MGEIFPKRKQVPKKVQAAVLTSCLRRCCLCYYEDGVRGVIKKGQIAHLNRDRSNSDISNLVYLCLNHHSELDTTSRHVKGVQIEEVRIYRDRLHAELTKPVEPKAEPKSDVLPLPESLTLVLESDDRLAQRRSDWRLLVHDEETDYLVAYVSPSGWGGVCRIHRRVLFDHRVLVVCEQLPGNPGTSITNSVEVLAFQVCVLFRIDPDKLVWIEHYGSMFGMKDFTRVEFETGPPEGVFASPSWHKMQKADWKELGLRPPEPQKRMKRRLFT